jgi:hypothetical protein
MQMNSAPHRQSQYRLRWWAYWSLPEPPTARHTMYEHSSARQQESEIQCWERRHFTQFILLATGATWRTAREQASYTASAVHRLRTCNFIHIYLVVLPVIEYKWGIRSRKTPWYHLTLCCIFPFINLKKHMAHIKETSLTKKWHVAKVLMIFKFSNSGVNCVILKGAILQRSSNPKKNSLCSLRRGKDHGLTVGTDDLL